MNILCSLDIEISTGAKGKLFKDLYWELCDAKNERQWWLLVFAVTQGTGTDSNMKKQGEVWGPKTHLFHLQYPW